MFQQHGSTSTTTTTTSDHFSGDFSQPSYQELSTADDVHALSALPISYSFDQQQQQQRENDEDPPLILTREHFEAIKESASEEEGGGGRRHPIQFPSVSSTASIELKKNFLGVSLEEVWQLEPVHQQLMDMTAPQASSMETRPLTPLDCLLLVQFKRGREGLYQTQHLVPPGQYVLVTADRGVDLGLVIQVLCKQPQQMQPSPLRQPSLHSSNDMSSRTRSSPLEQGRCDPFHTIVGSVLRQAEPSEVSQLYGVITELENKAIHLAQQCAWDQGLIMQFLDAEYQFDRRKLTLLYRSPSRVEFRKLLKNLFRIFRVRLWLETEEEEEEI